MKGQWFIPFLAVAAWAWSGASFAHEEGEEAPTAPTFETVPNEPAAVDEQAATVEPVPADATPVGEKTSGDVLSMPEPATERPAPHVYIQLPQRGMKMAQVEKEFGAPANRHPAIGKPPITRWDYDGFSVFFEYQTVLYSLRPDRPAEIYKKEELQPAH